MKNIKKCLIVSIGLVISTASACKKDFLERQPVTVVADEDLWKDQKLIVGLLANYYNRIPTDMGLTDQVGSQWRNMANYDDAMWSGQTNADLEARNNIINYGNSNWFLYDYGFIRDLNLAIENTDKYGAATLTEAQRTQLKAEFRFIRAYQYFEMVKREGGVPLVTKQLIYDYSGDASPLQQPRAKEAEVYDFIASEMDAIQNDIGNSTDASKFADVTRANKYTCLALKSRAMLYAASIAKYNAQLTPGIVTANGEVGIPASRAPEYYQKALDASKAVINSGFYALYNSNPNLGENFYEAIRNKTGNKEVLFVRDFLTAKAKKHAFTYDNIARGLREDNLSSSSVTPSLNLVESYDYLDGSNGALRTTTANGDYIYYNNLTDIFANKDARLYGTVIYPGAPFKGATVTMQAGVLVWNAATNSYQAVEGSDLATNYTDGRTLVAASGPHRSIAEVSNTGFYMRKFIDQGGGTSTRGILSDVWWVWFRLSEMYLDAAEAAFELGQTADAVTYINPVRARAGFTGANLYNAATLTRDKIRAEFRTEFAFEDHRVWDLKRWRIADQVWNGNATNPNAVVYALYPYRIVRPGDAARDGKFVFVKMVAPRFKAPRFFQQFNYYSRFDQAIINNNPKIIQNPFN
ncbi:MAG: RagB/SusD family nutrient uptake outer membrane protein [Sphingobacteriaceae bacterium]|nr:MAG: RagB/SusD family nutrient uptake outer membrane protein [Sphingobacteriaceae bacterium]